MCDLSLAHGSTEQSIPASSQNRKIHLETSPSLRIHSPRFFMQNPTGVHLNDITNNDDLFILAGKSKTSFVDARDVGIASATVLNNWKTYQNTAHTITGSESLSYTQVADIMSKVLNRPITYSNPGFIKYRHPLVHHRGLDKGYVRVTMMLYLMTRLETAKKITTNFKELTGRRQHPLNSL